MAQRMPDRAAIINLPTGEASQGLLPQPPHWIDTIMTHEDRALRARMIETLKGLNAQGLNQGTSGNISVRQGDRMLITPSAVPYEAMEPDMMASLPISGTVNDWTGPLKPSTEVYFHHAIMQVRPEVNAILHIHPTYGTALAMCRRSIPAAHYMVAIFGGVDVRCSSYARYGSPELAEAAIEALRDRKACLLANHGTISLGSSIEQALWHAVELEALARMYAITLSIGGPVILADSQIADTQAAMKGYGLQDKPRLAAK
jgi:L-fuculose-phosphate aldolase